MAIKKSELYSSLWASCDQLRGGMDASQYKDYVLTLLFVKYVSDKYANQKDSLIEIPKGATFEDMVALKGNPEIGDHINKKILKPLFSSNGLDGSIELVDFNDDDKLGEGKEKIDRLSNLIEIFENPSLDFKNNRAEDDDLLGDAYEYLMKNFATESGKSKGQFYTPPEVSRIISKIIDVHKADKPSFTAYDPTCGSGSLLLKVAYESPKGLSLYGQEKDITTKSLAIMNMWLHGFPEALIKGKNTIADPQFKEKDGRLKRFDFAVANPPFSTKSWSNGISPSKDIYNRFSEYGIPPDKNGDFAFLLHLIASLKSTGKGAMILPHGVLFRGNAEGEIRKNLIERKIIKGIIGLPANLFFGTGIPACIIVIDKENAKSSEGIFMIDASKEFIKDGNKNRLRERDIHKIVDAFNHQWELDKYSRFVPFDEIAGNEFNLNIPRYIDTQETEDIQDLSAHLNGGIPNKDIDALNEYWKVYPNLKAKLFAPLRDGYSKLNVDKTEVKESIFNHSEFIDYRKKLNTIFEEFKANNHDLLHGISSETKPKEFIHILSEDILERYSNRPLIVRYDIYQHLMDYWYETMKDDVYIIMQDEWQAKTKRIIEKNKKGKEVDKGWTCDLLPKHYIVDTYFTEEKDALQALEAKQEQVQAEISEAEEEHTSEDGLLADATTKSGKLSKGELKKQIKALKNEADEADKLKLMKEVLDLFEEDDKLKKQIKQKDAELDKLAYEKYPTLSPDEVKQLVIENKWLTEVNQRIDEEIDAISQHLAARIKELAERYAYTLGEIETELSDIETKVNAHLEKMGLVWSK
jgi:type I restriction enzyme M protein